MPFRVLQNAEQLHIVVSTRQGLFYFLRQLLLRPEKNHSLCDRVFHSVHGFIRAVLVYRDPLLAGVGILSLGVPRLLHQVHAYLSWKGTGTNGDDADDNQETIRVGERRDGAAAPPSG